MRVRLPDDRAVSEVLGFILVFSLVVSAVAIVSVFGFQSLEDTRNNEEVRNAERAFDVLRDNLADIHRQGAPSRATEISLENAQLEAGDPVEINVTGVNPSGPPDVNSFSYNPIVFDSRTGTQVVYSGGAVFLDPREGGRMVQEPPLIIDDEKVVFPVIQTALIGDTTSAGGQTVRVRAEQRQRQPLRGFTDPDTDYDKLIVNITSPRSDLWAAYFESKSEPLGFDVTCTSPRPDNVRCTIPTQSGGPESIYVSRTLINYEFET